MNNEFLSIINFINLELTEKNGDFRKFINELERIVKILVEEMGFSEIYFNKNGVYEYVKDSQIDKDTLSENLINSIENLYAFRSSEDNVYIILPHIIENPAYRIYNLEDGDIIKEIVDLAQQAKIKFDPVYEKVYKKYNSPNIYYQSGLSVYLESTERDYRNLWEYSDNYKY